MRLWLVRSTLLILVLALSGCVNNYSKFYTEHLSKLPAETRKSIIKFSGEPQLVGSTGDHEKDRAAMNQLGYVMIGYSSFHATGGAGREELIAQAKNVGAERVVIRSEFMSTEQGVVPLTLPSTTTSYHSGTVSAYNPSGSSAYGNYSGTTTNYGTQTTYIPYTRQRYNYLAMFFGKLKSPILGVRWRGLNPEEQEKFSTTTGVLLLVVMAGSPAQNGGLVPGDLIKKVDDIEVSGTNELRQYLNANKGNRVTFTIIRKSRKLEKDVQLGGGASS